MPEFDLARAYESMVRIRRTEETISKLRVDGVLVGSIHLCNGQEAIPVGATSALGDRDVVFGNYRGHGWALACGVPPERLIAELAGRVSGISGGRGGSAYFTAPEFGFYGENAIIGAQLPQAVGAALAGRFDGTNRCVVTVLGDGAMNQGAVYEAFNLAGAMRLPVVFVLENNLYSELTPISAMVADPDLYRRGDPFGVPGRRIDGNDPATVATAVGEALDRARSGAGPSLIEAMTYRLAGHYIGDAQTYRSRAEVEAAAAKEPLVRARDALRAAGLGDTTIDAIDTRVGDEVAEATRSALAADPAPVAKVKEHLYA